MSYPALAHAPAPAHSARVVPLRPLARTGAPAAYGAAGAYGASAAQAARYRDAELASAAPGQLVVMLFDKCVLTVRRAQAAFVAGDVEARAGHLCKAAEMVAELRASLDMAAAGPAGAISAQLDALYAWSGAELFAANREQSPARLTPVLRVLGELRDAFAGAQAQVAAQAASLPAARIA